MPKKTSYTCPSCSSQNIKRNGTHKETSSQKLVCKDCGLNFRAKYLRKAWNPGSSRQIQRLLYQGESIRSIAHKMNLSPTTIQNRRQFLRKDFISLIKQSQAQKDVFEVKSPLRYPGGKAKVLDVILPYIPIDIKEFREPFIGGGSVFLAVKSLFGKRIQRYWINDIQQDLYHFWESLQNNADQLVRVIMTLRQDYKVGKKLYQHLIWNFETPNPVQRAARFFILNRITFSGVIEAGGYSENAFQQRFTESAINKLPSLAEQLHGVNITCSSYESLLAAPGQDVFLYLDPPYLSATSSKLYGERGELHVAFDHERFAYHVKNSPHRWMITYDDAPEIRQLFSFAHIHEWYCQYGMNNYKQSNAQKGSELIISNFV